MPEKYINNHGMLFILTTKPNKLRQPWVIHQVTHSPLTITPAKSPCNSCLIDEGNIAPNVIYGAWEKQSDLLDTLKREKYGTGGDARLWDGFHHPTPPSLTSDQMYQESISHMPHCVPKLYDNTSTGQHHTLLLYHTHRVMPNTSLGTWIQ